VQIKVLVVDDSSLVRKVVTDILTQDPEIRVVGTANNGKMAIEMTQELDPDVITMDIEMPVLDGLAALGHIMSIKPKPVVMLSVLTEHGAEATFKALELGAVDFILKPSSLLSASVDEINAQLIKKVKAAASTKNFEKTAEPARVKLEARAVSDKIVVIGTSTGGPSALINIFRSIPENFPSPVLVVQHMPEGFTTAFSRRLDDNSSLNVKEAEHGDDVLPGRAYIAPGHSHMAVEKKGSGYSIKIFQGDRVSGHMPSIDVLFSSIAENVGSNAVGIIMTGMGRDGAEGLKRIRQAGGHTIAQDEGTSVVYGMNRVAVELGAVNEIVPLAEIVPRMVHHL
jgi:two-component system chemotaxis response regulator CheB